MMRRPRLLLLLLLLRRRRRRRELLAVCEVAQRGHWRRGIACVTVCRMIDV